MSNFINRVLQLLLNEDMIDVDEKEIYEYGLHILFLKVIHICSILLFSYLLGNVAEVLCFLICYTYLRQYTGGFHAHTSFACWIISLLIVYGIFILQSNVNFLVQICANIFSIVVIWGLCPIISIHNPIDKDLMIRNRKISIISSIIYLMIWIITVVINIRLIADAITFGLFFCAVFLIIARFQSGEYICYGEEI